MSDENVQAARRLFPRGMDLAAVFSDPELLEATRRGLERMVHPDVETITDPAHVPMGDFGPDSPTPGIAVGVDGFIRLWRDWLTTSWETWVLGEPEFVDVDRDRVLVLYEVSARSKTHQVEMGFDTGTLITLRDGLLVRIELFLTRAKALAAAGLSE